MERSENHYKTRIRDYAANPGQPARAPRVGLGQGGASYLYCSGSSILMKRFSQGPSNGRDSAPGWSRSPNWCIWTGRGFGRWANRSGYASTDLRQVTLPQLRGIRRGGTAGAARVGKRQCVRCLPVELHDDRGPVLETGGGRVCGRTASPWNDRDRRSSHAEKRRAWRWTLLTELICAVRPAELTDQEIRVATKRLLGRTV
jgi:hypothetical protein